MHARLFTDMIRRLEPFYTREEAEQWMRSEQKLLGGRRPVDCAPHDVWTVIELENETRTGTR
jgi:uncharacterized protein (DUF2384 family)